MGGIFDFIGGVIDFFTPMETEYKDYKISNHKRTLIDSYLKPYCEKLRTNKPFNRNIFYSAMHDLDLTLDYNKACYEKIVKKIENCNNTEAKIIFKKVCKNVCTIYDVGEERPFANSEKFAAGAFYLMYGASLLKSYDDLLKGPDFIIRKLKQEGWY